MVTMFLTDLLSKTSCFRLKFKKDKSVIGFVKKIGFSETSTKRENQ